MFVVYGFSAEYVVNSVYDVRVFCLHGCTGLSIVVYESGHGVALLPRASLVVNFFMDSGLVDFGCFGMWKKTGGPPRSEGSPWVGRGRDRRRKKAHPRVI